MSHDFFYEKTKSRNDIERFHDILKACTNEWKITTDVITLTKCCPSFTKEALDYLTHQKFLRRKVIRRPNTSYRIHYRATKLGRNAIQQIHETYKKWKIYE